MVVFLTRYANINDIKKVFLLSNDDTVRQNSINQQKIKWENHVAWFNDRIKNTNEPFYIIETSECEFIGQVRFEKKEEVIISISIMPDFRGKGLASEIIKFCTKKSKLNNILAYIKEENLPSQRSFLKAGYCFLKQKENYLIYQYKKL